MSDKPIVQYRAMGSRRSDFKVVGCHKLPAKVLFCKMGRPDQTGRMPRRDYETIQWGLTRTKAFATANALNALNNLPPHEDTQK